MDKIKQILVIITKVISQIDRILGYEMTSLKYDKNTQ